jgi:hypothetical protein
MFVGKEHPLQSSDPVRHPAPSPAPAHTLLSFDHERENASFILNILRTPFLAPKLQPSHSQKLAHSFTDTRNVTPAFPVTSALSLHSFVGLRNSTPVFSSAPALFVKSTREGVGAKANSSRAKLHSPCRRTGPEVRARASVPGPCRTRRDPLRSSWSSRAASAREKCRGKQLISKFRSSFLLDCTCNSRRNCKEPVQRVWAVLAAHAIE